MSCHLAIDLGAESGRVLAGVVSDDAVRLEEVHRFPNGPVHWAGTLRWPITRLWDNIQTGLAQAAREYGDQIASVGCDTWGVDFGLLSESGELLGLPFNHRDPRNRNAYEAAFETVPRDEVFAATGIQFMEINTLYQWLASKRHTPELLAQASAFLMMPDLIHWLLSGERRAEFTNATTTQFVDPTTRDWARGLLERFELPTGLLPPIVEPGQTIGTLRPDLAERLGLPQLPVIAPPTHDTGAAVAAIPTEQTGRANWAYISSGTWSLIGVETQRPYLSVEASAMNLTNEGGVCGTNRLLKNVMGMWLVQGIRKSLKTAGRDIDYGTLADEAAAAEPFRSLIDPNDPRFLAPADMAAELQAACRDSSQPVPETAGQLARCALESLALKYREIIGRIESLTGETVETIHVVGGGSKNRLLNQLTADVCGVPVVAGPVEATGLGNVLFQARPATDLDGLRSLRDLVRRTHELERFDPSSHDLGDVLARFDQVSTTT